MMSEREVQNALAEHLEEHDPFHVGLDWISTFKATGLPGAGLVLRLGDGSSFRLAITKEAQ